MKTPLFLFFATVLLIGWSTGCCSYTSSDTTDGASVAKAFTHPPSSSKPFVYWYWISNNVSKEGITKDLEAMHRVGIGGVDLAHIGFKGSPVGEVAMLSPQWWDCLAHALQEAGRLGMEVNLFNSPGWSGVGGPWIKPTQAMRYLDIHEYRVKGGQKLSLSFPSYQSTDLLSQESLSFSYTIDKSSFRFQPVKVVAFPTPQGYDELISQKSPVIRSTPHTDAVRALFDGNDTTLSAPLTLPLSVELQSADPFTARSLEIVPGKAPLACWCKLEYMTPAGRWVEQVNRRVGRGETRIIASGFHPHAPVASSFAPVTATRYRITLSESKDQQPSNAWPAKAPVRLAELKLWGAARVNDYIEKQLGNKASYAPTSPQPIEQGYALDPSTVIDLTAHVSAEGTLEWEVPAGNWTIQHGGMNQTGVKVHPVPSPDMGGFAADLFNPETVEYSFDSFIGEILRRIPPQQRPTLKRVVVDSYEQGSANWTDRLAEQFAKAYGYDPTPWIPVLKGYVVGSEEQSERFLWDLRRLMADLLPETFTRTIRERSHAHGLRFWHEPYGGHGFPGEFLLFGKYSEESAGEFWVNPTESYKHCRAAVSVANIYGHSRVVSAEAFTAGNHLYRSAPRDLKKLSDGAFAAGINHYTLHLSIHQPDERKPGINTWYGTEFNRHNNWFEQSKEFIDYLRRCSGVLQQGRRQTDYVLFIGEEVPVDVPAPATELPSGYDYDYINYDALIRLARVKNKRLVLPSGASYGLLVLPPSDRMRPELLARIKQLAADGLPIYGTPPVRSCGLKGYPGCDDEVKTAARELWNSGKIITRGSLGDVLAGIGIPPDLILPPDFVYTHRRTGNEEIYFVANQTEEAQTVTLDFRVEGKHPHLWNPVSGEQFAPASVERTHGRTRVSVTFPPTGSWLVVFTDHTPDSPESPSPQTVQTIEAPWQVSFERADGTGSFDQVFDRLTDWSLSDDPSVRYFCGKATYSAAFTLDEWNNTALWLHLGRVESLASVSVNKKEVGTRWCYPYRFDLTGAIQKGENRLEITLVNPWWNQLIGEQQPGAKQNTYVSARQFWKASDPLVSNGLLGPVTLEREQRAK